MKRAFVTGAAGFIGSTLVDRLLADQVWSFSAYRQPGFKLIGAAFDGDRFWSIADSPARVIRHELIADQKAPQVLIPPRRRPPGRKHG